MEDEVFFGHPGVVCEFDEASTQQIYPISQSNIHLGAPTYNLY